MSPTEIFTPEKISLRLVIYTFAVIITASNDYPIISGLIFFFAIMDALHVTLNKLLTLTKTKNSAHKKNNIQQTQQFEPQSVQALEKTEPYQNPLELAKTNSSLASFNISEKVCAISKFTIETGMAFDFEKLQVCVYSFILIGKQVQQSVISFPIQSLLSIDIIENGFSLSQSTTSTQGSTSEKTAGLNMLGRAAVGGILFGGVGAVIGGLSAKRTGEISTTATTNTFNKEMVSDVSLKLLINDTKEPIINLKFLTSDTNKTSPEYKSAYQKIERCDALLRVMINRATASDK